MWNLMINKNGVWLYLARGGGFTLDVNNAEKIVDHAEAHRLKEEYSEHYQTRLRHRLWL